jgi:hypothetical protein
LSARGLTELIALTAGLQAKLLSAPLPDGSPAPVPGAG